jgi:hypothetical protein
MSLQEADEREDIGSENGSAGQNARLELEVAYADSIRSTDWKPAVGPWEDLVSVLMDHHEQAAKDGRCFVPGRLLGSQRKDTDVVTLGLAMFDVDNGEDVEGICEKVEAAGLEAVVHTTHSHGRRLSSIKVSAYTRYVDGAEIRPDLLAEYLIKSRRILPNLVQDLRITKLPDAGDEDGVIEVEHAPISKCRIAMPLAHGFQVAGLLRDGISLQQIKSRWKAGLDEVARVLGISTDPQCFDLSRAYYFPSHPPGALHFVKHIPGRFLDLAPFLDLDAGNESDHGKRSPKDDDRSDHIVTDRNGCSRDLKKWDARYGSTCRLADIIRASASGLIHERGDNTPDKQHIRCPFEDEHSNPDEGSGTFVANPGRIARGRHIRTWIIHCRHASCCERTPLNFLRALLEQGHLTFRDLTNSASRPDDQAQRVDGRITKYAEKWAIINSGGKVLVLNMAEPDISKALLAEPDFKRLHRHDYCVQEDQRGREVTAYWAEQFIKRPPAGTKFFTNGFCFKPGGNSDPHSFNLFAGLHEEPCPSGSCDLFRELIFSVWADGDQEVGEWLWEYFLHLVARPGERIRTSIAIRGSQGAGKSIVFDMLREIFRDMLLVVDNQNLVLGAFNESLVGKLAVVCEEAAFAGDRAAFQKMKNLITGATIHINAKHKAPISVANFARIFLISNEEHFLHLEPGDRRYTVVEVSDAWKSTDKYQQMWDQWVNGGARRFVWEAGNHQFRMIPGTQTLVINKNLSTTHATSQISQSRDPLQQAIVDLLLRGEFVSMRDGLPLTIAERFRWRMDEELQIESLQLQAYLRAVLHTSTPHRVEHLTSLRRIVRELERFCGPIEQHKFKRKDLGTGFWKPAPTQRILPTRGRALDHALAKCLITDEEHEGATAETLSPGSDSHAR